MAEDRIIKKWSFDFDYSVSMGETYTKFMEGLIEKKFLGNKCGGRTFFPPLPFCDRTYELPDQWLESDGSGTVETFTVVYQESNRVEYPRSSELPQTPYVLAVIKVNGSDQCLIHFMSGFDTDDPDEWHKKIEIGTKVRPVWAEERRGNILDIKFFVPVD